MRRVFVGAIVLLVASTAFAVNSSVFHDAPITRLSEAELEAFVLFVDKSLDGVPDGKTVEWKAPKARFVSKITPHKSFTQAGNRCREATIESDSHDRYQRGRYLFCKTDAGAWQLTLPAARPAAGK